jgi:hypothetical protein
VVGVGNWGEVKWISKGRDFRLKQLMNKLDDSAPRHNNMEILLVEWFILTGRNYLLLLLLCTLQRRHMVTNRMNFLHVSSLCKLPHWS